MTPRQLFFFSSLFQQKARQAGMQAGLTEEAGEAGRLVLHNKWVTHQPAQ